MVRWSHAPKAHLRCLVVEQPAAVGPLRFRLGGERRTHRGHQDERQHQVFRHLKLFLVAAIVGAVAVGSAWESEHRCLEVKHEFQQRHPC